MAGPATIISKVVIGLDTVLFWIVAAYVYLKPFRDLFYIPILLMLLGFLVAGISYDEKKDRQNSLTGGIILLLAGVGYLWYEIAFVLITIPGPIIITIGAIVFSTH